MTHYSRIIEDIPWALYGVLEDKKTLRLQLERESRELPAAGERPFFSLLTPLWNTPPAFLEQLIRSCLVQSYSGWELILVDDGSSDQSHIALALQHTRADARIRFTQLPHNLGISGARNHAFEQSRGRYIGVLDHDDCLHPRILGLYFRAITGAAAPPQLLYCNEVKIDAAGRLLSDFFFKPAFHPGTLLRTNYIAHFAVVERAAIEQLKLRDGQIFSPHLDGVEDHDYFLRLASTPHFSAQHLPVFGYLWRKSPSSTALQLDAKPQVRQRLVQMLEQRCGERYQVEASRGHPQCFPSLRPRAELEAPLPLRIWGWGPGRDEQLAEELARQEGVRCIFGTSDEAPTLILFVQRSIRFEAADSLSRLAAFLLDSPTSDFVVPRVLDAEGHDCGEWRAQISAHPSLIFRARFTLAFADFPADERIGAFPSPYVCLGRSAACGGLPIAALPEAVWLQLLQLFLSSQRALFYAGTVRASLPSREQTLRPLDPYFAGSCLERHFPAFQEALGHQMAYDVQLRTEDGFVNLTGFVERELRYRIVDSLNAQLKRWLGPVHRLIKKFLWKTAMESTQS